MKSPFIRNYVTNLAKGLPVSDFHTARKCLGYLVAFLLLFSLVAPVIDPTSAHHLTIGKALASSAQITHTIRALNATFQRGQTNDLMIELDSPGAVTGVSFSLKFDKNVLTYKGVALGNGGVGAINPPTEVTTQLANGRIGLALLFLPTNPPKTIPPGKQIILIVKFDVVSNSQASSTKIEFDKDPDPPLPFGIDKSGDPVPEATITKLDATVTIPSQCTATITVNQPAVNKGIVGAVFNQSFTQTGGVAPVTFTLNSGTLSTGLTLNPNGMLSGTPTQSGSFPITVKATDANGCMGVSATYMLTISSCPTITVSAVMLPAGTVGNAFNGMFAASGGTPPYTFSLSAGMLPPGLSLSPNGSLTGTPTQSGSFNFTIKATDANGCMGTQPFTIAVSGNQPPTISPPSMPVSRQQGNPPANSTIANVSDANQAANTLVVTVNGSSTVNGVTISGISVSTAGLVTANVVAACNATTANFTLRVTDSSNLFAEATLTVTVTPNSPPMLGYASPPTVVVGNTTMVTPNVALSDSGSVASIAVQSVTPAFGGTVTVNNAGVVSISNAKPAGSYTVTIRATDNCGAPTNATFTLNVMCPMITLNPMTLPSGAVGTAYNQPVSATGGTAPYTLSISAGTLPNGLSLNASTGAITGTPTTAVTSNFTVKATDANGCMGTRDYVLIVSGPGTAQIEIAPSAPTTNDNISVRIFGNWPNGCTPQNPQATVTGTQIRITTSNSAQVCTQAITPWSHTLSIGKLAAGDKQVVVIHNGTEIGHRSFTVVCATITITPVTLPNGAVGTAYNQTVSASGGTVPYTFSISAGALPAGLSLNPSTGTITGTPTTPATSMFTVKATDANVCAGMRQYTVTISPQCPTGANTTPTNGAVGSTVTITGSGFTGVTAVKFANNVNATFTTNSNTQITATVPSGAVTGPITISKTGCTDVQTATFTITQSPACPTVASINPTSGIVGSLVTISGTNFTGATAVKFSNNVTATFTIVNATTISATVPTGAVTGPITISKTSCPDVATSIFTVTVTCAPVVTTQPANQTTAVGSSATFTAAASGTPAPTVQWQMSTDSGTTFSNISGATSTTLTVSQVTQGDNGKRYRAVFTNSCGIAMSNAAILTVNDALTLLSVIPIETPIIANKQFFVRIEGSGFDPSKIEVVYLGAGCPGENPCVITNNKLIGKSNTKIDQVPLTLPEGTFQIHLRNGSGAPLSNCLPLTVSPLVVGVSAANYRTEVTADSIIALFCRKLANGVGSAPGVPLPTTLLGTSVKIRDKLAELFYVSPTQVNCRIPSGTAAGMATITVMIGNDVVAIGEMQIATVSPGLFTANANGQGIAAAVVLRVKANEMKIYDPVSRFDSAQGRFVVVPIDLNAESPVPDKVYLILFGTGIRGRSSLNAVTASVAGVGLPAIFAGAQGSLIGLDQVNLGPIPLNLAGRGLVNVTLRIDGKDANTVQLVIK